MSDAPVPISVTYFLSDYKLAGNTNGILYGAEVWSLEFFKKASLATERNARL